MSETDRPRCATCPHWQRNPQNLREGNCHAKAPSPNVVVTDGSASRLVLSMVWPPTKADEWCGEHPQAKRQPLILKEGE